TCLKFICFPAHQSRSHEIGFAKRSRFNAGSALSLVDRLRPIWPRALVARPVAPADRVGCFGFAPHRFTISEARLSENRGPSQSARFGRGLEVASCETSSAFRMLP